MKIICELTDKKVLGTDGHSTKSPRLTARAILQNREGLYAVMYVQKFHLYSLPGGGVNFGETPKKALARELLEETGCNCDEITELGRVLENRASLEYTQDNYYYHVKTFGTPSSPQMTEKEIANETVVEWHTFEEMYHRIASPIHDTAQRKYIQARDMAVLNAYTDGEKQ